MKDKLYIIGNGFDIAHGIESCYCKFKVYCEKKALEYFNTMNYIYDNNVKLWSQFENELANINKTKFKALIEQYIAPYYRRTRGVDCYNVSIQDIVDYLWSNTVFCEWVHSINISECTRLMEFDPEISLFLNFNYTKTLENVYGIPADDILHIHGKFTKDNELDANAIIVGHGASVKEIDEKFGNDDDEMTKELKDLVNHFRKDTSKIISDNADFWSSLKDVNDVYVFGHSMADVDLPYFKKVKESIKPDALWHISVYKEGKISVMKSYVIDKLALSEDKVCVKTFTEFCKRG